MARHVRQRFARVVRVFQHLRVGVAVAGDNIGVLGRDPARSTSTPWDRTRPAVLAMVFTSHAFVVQHVAFVDIKQRDIGGNAVEQVELRAQFVGVRGFPAAGRQCNLQWTTAA